MVSVKNLSKYFGSRAVLHGLNFSIEKGELVALLGLNGAGKSTLLKLLTGINEPTTGSVSIGGLSMAQNPKAARAQIGYLPDVPPLYLDMTVHRYLRFAARLRGLSGHKAALRVAEVEELTGIEDV